MKNRLFVFIVLLIFSSQIYSQSIEPVPRIDGLAFMSGCWEINVPARKLLVTEQWMAPFGDAMIGMARTVRDGKMGSYEYLRIVQKDGGIQYIAKPSQSQNETSFKLIKLSINEAIFENPEHDFPQKIFYKLNDSDNLAARIEGTMNGQKRGMDFPYKRAKCS